MRDRRFRFAVGCKRRRDLGKLIFVWLRDYTGIVQIVFDQSRFPEVFEKAGQLRSEYVIAVRGVVEKELRRT